MLTKGYEYDSSSQLRRVYPAGSSGTNAGLYDFNPFGERARKDTSSGGVTQVTLYTYLPGGNLLGETIFDNNVLAEQRDYVWMDDTPVAMHVTKVNPAADGSPRHAAPSDERGGRPSVATVRRRVTLDFPRYSGHARALFADAMDALAA